MRFCSSFTSTPFTGITSMRSKRLPRANAICAAYTSISSRSPPNTFAGPRGKSVPRTVKSVVPAIVSSVILSPILMPFFCA